MRRALAVLLVALFAVSLSADDRRAGKRKLIDEVLRLMDAKALTRSALGRFFAAFAEPVLSGEDLPEEQRAQLVKAQQAQQEQLRVFQERVLTHLDQARIAEEVYVPLIDRSFNEDELRELIGFLSTKSGQKLVGVMPDLGVAAFTHGRPMLEEAMTVAQQELEQEERAKDPAQATMADMRLLAVALEARATDTHDYPAGDLDSLVELLEPTYVQKMPRLDGWGTPFLYVSDGRQYRIVSAGADKRFEWDSRHLVEGVSLVEGASLKESESLDADIIFEDGALLQAPKGGQQ